MFNASVSSGPAPPPATHCPSPTTSPPPSHSLLITTLTLVPAFSFAFWFSTRTPNRMAATLFHACCFITSASHLCIGEKSPPSKWSPAVDRMLSSLSRSRKWWTGPDVADCGELEVMLSRRGLYGRLSVVGRFLKLFWGNCAAIWARLMLESGMAGMLS